MASRQSKGFKRSSRVSADDGTKKKEGKKSEEPEETLTPEEKKKRELEEAIHKVHLWLISLIIFETYWF